MNSINFRHYIITRFNVRVDEWKQTRNKEMVLTDEWLKHRFDLFDRFCFPSVMNQSEQKFKWLVFFDITTDANYRTKIAGFADRYRNFIPLFIDGYSVLLETLKDYIQKDMEGQQYVITSRVDNDDCIHRDFVKEIHNSFDRQDACIIDIVDGYQFILNENQSLHISEIRKARGYFNPFVSLIENASQLNTIMSREHLQWKNMQHILAIKNKRLWGEIIHNKNKLNAVRPMARLTRHIDHDVFALNKNDIELDGTFTYMKHMTSVEYRRLYYFLKRNAPAGLKKTIKAISN